jgi:hypothetical protein
MSPKNYLSPRATTLVGHSEKIRRLFQKRKEYIFIASMPKSGSTFMAKAMVELSGYSYAQLTYAYENDEQNLYLPRLIDAYTAGTVTHQHLRATGPNVELLKRFGIRPVVLTRNIFDIVVSIRDHILNEGPAFPSFYCDQTFLELSQEVQFDFIIELGVPWYFNFYASWYEAKRNDSLDILWLTYEQVISDWNEALRRLVDFYRMERSAQEIAEAIERTMAKQRSETRLNKGVAGRGRSTLSEQQMEKISAMARFYPAVDFSLMGLSS